jgi:multisubunit Na+/H+ antiporter MnhG subunit
VSDESTGALTGASHGRPETPEQRSDRNWNELLQELRVLQTGVQILTGFLLILPFQSRFAELDDLQRTVYLVDVLLCIGATGVFIAPVALHRALFRRHMKTSVVTGGDRFTRVGLVLLAVALSATTMLIFDVVLGRVEGIVVGGAVALVLLVLWAVLPVVVGRRH